MASRVIVNDELLKAKGFSISADKLLLDLDYVYRFLREQSYWGKNLPFDKFKTSIENSVCFGIYHHQIQIGFARVITDQSTFAYLADVFIDVKYRKQSLAKWLLQSILKHPDFKDMKRWLLATADAHSLYTQFGFEPLTQPERFMQIVKPYPKS